MRLAISRIAEAVLALGVLVLLVLLLAPWGERPLPRPAAADASVSTSAPTIPAATPATESPDAILPLFIGKPAAKAPAPAPAAKPPVDATWLLYLGRSRAADGLVTWFVKDTKTGRIIRAAKGDGADAWIVVEEKATSLLLKNAGILYSVVKR